MRRTAQLLRRLADRIDPPKAPATTFQPLFLNGVDLNNTPVARAIRRAASIDLRRLG